ncbi:MAG: DUF4340 domain-containing protein [Ignavibacteriales bacterium]|nr:DUF4340 domain-containing protein [Ignavibacteriales bacterium]MCF8305789.1 DUF4340 domain-containing protein [Ignavibacteriales bacterium]MCF8315511.1 DUF4340 domain-containing protein [Ignavibacteriales bacterium]MCF8436960.1 DUF4340 domain-containing protein [Ignavibacteriales bacterium]
MFKKLNNKKLGLLFGILLISVILFYFLQGKGNSRSFREDLVSIDTTLVSKITIYPKSSPANPISLIKEKNFWQIRLADGKKANVPDQKIKNIFSQLISIKPKSLAARDQKKWQEFQVDSSGTRVKVFEEDELSLDIIIGKFAFRQPRSMSTYVRLNKDIDVYEVDGFIEASFNQDANSFRDNKLIQSISDKFRKLSFSYPADSSFVLTKEGGKWMIGNLPADSAKTENYLRQLNNLYSSAFIDDIPDDYRLPEVYSVKIESGDSTHTIIRAFNHNGTLVLNSTDNADSYFDYSKNDLGKKIFTGPSGLR